MQLQSKLRNLCFAQSDLFIPPPSLFIHISARGNLSVITIATRDIWGQEKITQLFLTAMVLKLTEM